MEHRTVRVEAQEPLLLLLIGHDIDERCRPFQTVEVLQLLQQDLNRLAVGRAHRDQMNALARLVKTVILQCRGGERRGHRTFAFLTSAGVSAM